VFKIAGEEEGPNCGGLAEFWGVNTSGLFSTAKLCCEEHFKWIAACPNKSTGDRRLKETSEDERKVAMQLEKANDLEMKARMATIEGDMKDMRDDMKDVRGDMKEIKELLAQFLSHKKTHD